MRFLSLSAAILSVAGIVSASKVVDLDTKNFDKVRCDECWCGRISRA